jgi:hypothetical protein
MSQFTHHNATPIENDRLHLNVQLHLQQNHCIFPNDTNCETSAKQLQTMFLSSAKKAFQQRMLRPMLSQTTKRPAGAPFPQRFNALGRGIPASSRRWFTTVYYTRSVW